MTCEECQVLIELFAVGALDEAQGALVRQHLATGCPGCNGAVAEATAAAAHLALALEPKAPPTSAKQELMRRLAHEPSPGQFREVTAGGAPRRPDDRGAEANPMRRESVVARVGTGAAAPSEPPESGRALPGKVNGGGNRWGPWRWRSAVAAGIAGLLIGLGAGGLGLLSAQRTHQQLEDDLAAGRQQIASLEEQVAQQQQRTRPMEEIAETAREFFGFLRRSSVQMASLQVPNEREDADPPLGRMFWDPEDNMLQLLVSQLTPPREGERYQVWVGRNDEDPVPAGTLTPDNRGNALYFGKSPKSFDQVNRLFVTLEEQEHDRPEGRVQFTALLDN